LAKKPKVIIIHTYYRLQPGNFSVESLVRRVTRKDLTDSNRDTLEIEFNKKLAEPMKACADFYYAADNIDAIKKAFTEMSAEVLRTKGNPVHVIE
jgi:hypothetical protein